MFSAFCLTAPNSGSGKTTLSIGLMRLLAKKNAVQAFKCGPDYIDTSYHNTASFRTSYNLDTWLMGEEEVQAVFQDKTKNCDIAIIEGVMGLFDGKFQKKAETKRKIPSIPGSTAHIAQILSLPLIMVIDCKGMAQSISAVVRGFYEQSKEYRLPLKKDNSDYPIFSGQIRTLKKILTNLRQYCRNTSILKNCYL